MIVWSSREESDREEHWAFLAVEALCKGLEIDLPAGIQFYDKDGHKRTKMRICWWDRKPIYRQVAFVAEDVFKSIPDDVMPQDARVETYVGPPVFFGHYWRLGNPILFADNI